MKKKAIIFINIHCILKLLFAYYVYFLFFPYTNSIDIRVILGVVLIDLVVHLPIYILLNILADAYDRKNNE